AALDQYADADAIGVAGQCAGSTTALVIAGATARTRAGEIVGFGDDRVKAVLAMSPQLPAPEGTRSLSLHEDSWATIAVPAMIVTGSRDLAFFSRIPDPDARFMPFEGLSGVEGWSVDIANAQHHAFTASNPWYPGDERDPRHHGWIAQASAAFLRANLVGDSAAQAWLEDETLERESGGEVTIRHTAGQARAPAAVFSADVELPGGAGETALPLRVTCPAAQGDYPVVVFSHAVGGSRDDFTPLVTYWAEHGLYCIQPTHAEGANARLSDSAWRDRPQDLLRILDGLDALAEACGSSARPDPEHVGVSGAYIGSYAAGLLAGMQVFPPGGETVSFQDARVDALLMLSPQGRGQGLTEQSWAGIALPTMVVTGSADASRRTSNPPQWRTEPFEFAGADERYLLWVEDLRGDYGGLTRGNGETLTAAWVRDATLAFWRATLHGEEDGRAYLNSGALELESGGAATITTAVEGNASDLPRPTHEACEAAADYSAAARGLAVLAMSDGEIIYERYDNGHSADTPAHIHSATKSFWGPAIAAMIDDGLVESWDSPVADVLTDWQEHRLASQATLRHVLNLSTALPQDVPNLQGLDGAAEDKYAHAASLRPVILPGQKFLYGPSHFYVLGAYMEATLAPLGEDPLDYLKRRILDPIGVDVGDWEHDPSGNPHIPNGAYVTARDWARFGQWVLQGGECEGEQVVSAELVADCLEPSEPNPGYGLTWWLNHPDGDMRQWKAPEGSPAGAMYPGGHTNIAAALGAGRNGLYLIPNLSMVVVRQGESGDWRDFSDAEFLGYLLDELPS
ncbi:MAG: serine hydrolase, partial [Armatimonadia bacterium]|nr:serine hydrolase [Armatimonadia bacterium]